MHVVAVTALCSQRGWSRSRLVFELRRAGAAQNLSLPTDSSLLRMLRQWLNGTRVPSVLYADLLTQVFGVPVEGVAAEPIQLLTAASELSARIAKSQAINTALIEGLSARTEALRVQDRRIGGQLLLRENESHIRNMQDLLTFALGGGQSRALAGELAAAASLAGWQALHLGRPDRAWQHYETSTIAARESGDAAALAHAMAEQAYALLDVGRVGEAANRVRQAREAAGKRVPNVLMAWLWAAQGEMAAAQGQDSGARRALDRAETLLPDELESAFAPVVLNEVHLRRWRGNCLASLGDHGAIAELLTSLNLLDPSFTRARAGLHCDLATAFTTIGDKDSARSHAITAQRLAVGVASVRQQRRIQQLTRLDSP